MTFENLNPISQQDLKDMDGLRNNSYKYKLASANLETFNAVVSYIEKNSSQLEADYFKKLYLSKYQVPMARMHLCLFTPLIKLAQEKLDIDLFPLWKKVDKNSAAIAKLNRWKEKLNSAKNKVSALKAELEEELKNIDDEAVKKYARKNYEDRIETQEMIVDSASKRVEELKKDAHGESVDGIFSHKGMRTFILEVGIELCRRYKISTDDLEIEALREVARRGQKLDNKIRNMIKKVLEEEEEQEETEEQEEEEEQEEIPKPKTKEELLKIIQQLQNE